MKTTRLHIFVIEHSILFAWEIQVVVGRGSPGHRRQIVENGGSIDEEFGGKQINHGPG